MNVKCVVYPLALFLFLFALFSINYFFLRKETIRFVYINITILDYFDTN